MTISVSTFSRERLGALLGLLGAHAPLERERLGHDTDGERAELASDLRDDGCPTGSGSSALAGRDEDHVRALQRLLQLVAALLRSGRSDLRIRAGTQAASRHRADVDLHVGLRHQQRLRVGVHGDELHSRHPRLDHAADRVRTAAADPDHLDHGEIATGLIAHLSTTSG